METRPGTAKGVVEDVLNLFVLIRLFFFDRSLSMVVFVLLFLIADTQLYKRLCPSVRPSVGPSVRLS